MNKKPASKTKAVVRNEPMTQKRYHAIQKLVQLQAERLGRIHYLMVDATIKATQMRAETLYQKLERKGYRWEPKYGWYAIPKPEPVQPKSEEK